MASTYSDSEMLPLWVSTLMAPGCCFGELAVLLWFDGGRLSTRSGGATLAAPVINQWLIKRRHRL